MKGYGLASTSLKRGVNDNDHSAAADSFCAGCLTGAGRVAAARCDAFLRRKYATRRLRLIRTRSRCPMESLWIENRRNAIGIETDPAFSTYGFAPSPLAGKTRVRALWAYSQSSLDSRTDIKPPGLVWAVEIVIAFSRDSLLKGTLMAQRESALFTVTPGSLSGLAVIFLLLAAFFALLNGQKVKALRANAVTPRAARACESERGATGGTTGAQQQGKTADTEDRAAKAEAALAQAEKEKADLKGKLDASQQEIAALRQRAAGAETNSNPSAPGTATAPADNAQSARFAIASR